MRPQNLKLEGFTAFKDPAEINFDGLQLTVFTGPNGSGKSSLLEAMLFALYGTTPRMKGKQAREFISHGKDSFYLALEFAINNENYRVERRYFKKGQSQVRLSRKNEERWQSIADKVKETDDAIVRILGIGYDTFTKAVILPQNLFDQFLKGDKEKRREVLSEILTLDLFDKVSSLAGEKGRLAKDRFQQAEAQLKDLRHTTSDENADALKKAEETCKTEIAALQTKQKQIVTCLSEVTRLLEKEKLLAALCKEKTELERDASHSSKELTANEKILSDMSAKLTQGEERFQIYVREQENLIELGRLFKEQETLVVKIQSLQKENQTGLKALTGCREKKKAAESKITELKIKNTDLRRNNQVHDLQTQLTPGEKCLVCGQKVHELPKLIAQTGDKETDLSPFEAALHRQLAEEAKLVEANSRLSKELTEASARLAEIEAKKARLENALAQVLSFEKTLLLSKARDEFKALKANQEKMNLERAQKEKALQESSRLKERLSQMRERLSKIQETETLTARELEALKQNLLKPLLELGYQNLDNLSRLQTDFQRGEAKLGELQAEIGKIKQQQEELHKNKAKAQKIQETQETFKKDEILYGTIQQDLQKNKLPDFLLSTVLTTLLDLAGEKFAEFSQGRYQFSLEGTGDIQVLDGWNANEARPVASLSGGESFAASLALALALSEYLQGRRQLQSLFIDEGFGNLDRETRDKVAEVLTALQSQDKLIGIVTHIEELAELFPHRIVVEKLPEGSRIWAN